MRYDKIAGGIFLSRPNRFIAKVMMDGKEVTAHVKNTGRCRELLAAGARLVLERSDNPLRKTAASVIGVYKGDGLFGKILEVKREKTYGNSRFDLYLRTEEGPWFVEVKGVTLFADGVARFPDAPTARGVKHLEELASCRRAGNGAAVLFVIQTEGMDLFRPNWETHAEFGQALLRAQQAGVKVLAYDCLVREDEMVLNRPVLVDLTERA